MARAASGESSRTYGRGLSLAGREIARLARGAWQDIFAVAGFLAAAFLIERDFIGTGDYLFPGGGDWFAHAYRARVIQQYGLTTWDHTWAGGLSPFQGYQFIPHVVTAVLASLANASIGRSMLFIEGVLVIWVRVSGYPTARLLGLPPAAAVLAGVITFGINDYVLDVATFSALWALAFFPLFTIAAFRYGDRPAGYVVAMVAGLSIYAHPHLFVLAAIALVSACLAQPPTAARLKRLVVQGGLMTLASSLFWLPVLFSVKPVMQDATSANVDFIRAMSAAEVERFDDVVWFLVPASVGAIIVFWHSVRFRLLRYITVLLGLTLFLIALSYAGAGPESLRLMQNVRLMSALALPLGLVSAVAVDGALRWASARSNGPALAAMGTIALAVALAVPLVRHANNQSHPQATFVTGPAAQWVESHKDELQGRIWVDDTDTSLYAYLFLGDVRVSQSHFGPGEWSLVAWPQQEGVYAGSRDYPTTVEYLKAMGVSYVVLPSWFAFAAPLQTWGWALGWIEEERFPLSATLAVSIYRTPWTPVSAFLTNAAQLPSIAMSNRQHYSNAKEWKERDAAVKRYNALAYSLASTPVAVEYPSATTMRLNLRDVPPDQYLVVSENWDRSWRARTASGESLHVDRYGPNYIGIDLSGVRGDVIVELRHEMSWDWKLGIALTVLSVPVAAGLTIWERRRRGGRAGASTG